MIKKAVERWPKNLKAPHFVADSAFGAVEIIEFFIEKKFTGTLALKKGNEPRLCSLISNNLPGNCFRAVAKGEMMLSVEGLYNENRHLRHKFLLHVGGTCSPKPIQKTQLLTNTSIECYKKEDLQKMKVVDLDKILKALNIPKGRLLKAQKIDKIANSVSKYYTNLSEYSPISLFFEHSFDTSESILHKFYREQFNTIDLLDRTLSMASERHGNSKWRSKIIIDIFFLATFNIYCYSTYGQNTKFVTFLQKLALSIIDKYEQ